ncbi:MAG: TonB-dependent receptor [Prolixibacteraceae bacterium]|jgi:TonB-linked SusC/RagA family outer membrane protein|nr:TonB-dependent receptor [Prolixibacteraceae bacterium]
MKQLLYKFFRFCPVLLLLMFFVAGNSLSGQETLNKDELLPTANDSSAVPVAYSSFPQWKITGAISSVGGDGLRQTTSSSLANALFARIPGLTAVQGSGEPGYDSPTLFVRGLSSYRQNRMIIVVDGFESSFEQLVPEEIESVSVLKDAAATALYGIRGANGILLVTTKKGINSAPQITFRAQTGIQKPVRLPEPLGSYDYARLYNEALANEGKPARYSAAALGAYQSNNDPYFHPNVNWYDQILRPSAPISNYDLNFRGGSENVKYFVLLNVFQSDGLYAHTDPKRKENSNAHYMKYNFRSNVDVDITDNLMASLYLGGRVEDRTSPGGIGSFELFDKYLLTPPNAFPVYNPDGTYGGNAIYKNPLAMVLGTGLYNDHNRNLQAVFRLNYKLDSFLPGLSVNGAVAFSNYFSGISRKDKTFAMYEISKAGNDTIYQQIGQDTPLSGAEGYREQWRRANTRLGVNYSRSFGHHDLDVMGMFLRDQYVIGGNNVPFAYENLAGSVNYAFRKKYVAQVSLSYSGSDNFPKSKKHGLFYAFSAGWIVSNETFVRESDWLTYLKIKASYGKTGNDQVGGQRFMYDQYFYQEGGYYFGTGNSFYNGYTEGSLANKNVTWEKRRMVNLGIESTIFKRVNVNLDIFNEKRFDILAEPYGTIPDFLGVGLPALNEGKVENQGFELQVQYRSPQERDFRYFIGGSAWYARNKILYMSEPVQPYGYLKRTGRSIGQPFGLVADGFYQEADFDASGNLKSGLPVPQFGPVQPGDLKYKNQNGDNVIDVYDYQPIGKPAIPEWTFGLETGFEFKGFDFSAFVQAVTNRTAFLQGSNVWAFQNNAGITTFALNRWTPQTAATADYPRLSSTTNVHNYQLSDFWQRDGSFLRLRTIELGYTLPQEMIRFAKLKDVRIYVNGNNLLTFDHVKISDPETMTGYPAMKSVHVGVIVKL